MLPKEKQQRLDELKAKRLTRYLTDENFESDRKDAKEQHILEMELFLSDKTEEEINKFHKDQRIAQLSVERVNKAASLMSARRILENHQRCPFCDLHWQDPRMYVSDGGKFYQCGECKFIGDSITLIGKWKNLTIIDVADLILAFQPLK